MTQPKNGIYIIQGEISLVVTAMRRSSKWTSHSHQESLRESRSSNIQNGSENENTGIRFTPSAFMIEDELAWLENIPVWAIRKVLISNTVVKDDDGDPLLRCFSQLKDVLSNIADLDEVEPNSFLSPFLDVIRSEDTTGPITGLALTSVNKVLSYGLVDPTVESAAAAIENIADAVTHARFVGTDPGSDEVVLMKILHVLRTLLLSAAGILLTNESVCEIMQSCFRICFEMRLSELLRKSAEHTLMDMVQLLFSRLPQFKEDPKWLANMKKLKMRTGGVDPSRITRKKRSPKPRPKRQTGASSNMSNVSSEEISQSITSAESTEKVCQNEGATDTSVAYVDAQREQVATVPGAPQDEVTDTGIAYVSASRERLATTPATPGEEGIIDISKRFQDATDRENVENVAETTNSYNESVKTDGSEIDSYDSGCLSDTSKVTLGIPQSEEIIRKSPSETDLYGSRDQLSLPSETGDDSESVQSETTNRDDFINQQGVRFTPHQHHKEGSGPLIPYGLPCVRELFRFLISLTNPIDRHNTDVMIHMGLSLLTVALESGADYISQYNSLLYLVKDEMCRHLFLLLQSERLSLFSASLRVCFLLFESMRSHLKFQLEMYLTKLTDIVVSDSPRIMYDMREIALESIVQLWRIPGLVTELYLNYDCDLYCSNLFEDLTKLLSKNAFPVSGLFSTHLLSLDALLIVVDSIEQHCHSRILNSTKQDSTVKESKQLNEGVTSDEVSGTEETTTDSPLVGPPTNGYAMAQRTVGGKFAAANDLQKTSKTTKESYRKGPNIRPNRMKVSTNIPSKDVLIAIKHKKKLYYTGTEQFNQKHSKGITFLQEQHLLSTPLDPGEVVTFLKENPRLDKAMIGEYISNKKNATVLEAFVKSFNFEDLRVDEALRLYLETFRLPGEAPVISYLIEHFSDHWFKSNSEPFANTDAAFTLTYAVIMLNVDQHNHNAKKQNVPMTAEDFKKNLKFVNGGEDFDQDMLEEIYNAIRGEEIVMPAEQTGLVRENYLWKVLLRRGSSKEGNFLHAPTGAFDHDLFTLIWGPTVAALSFVFDKSMDESIIQKAIAGFRKCAMISANYGMSDVFDNLVISLCKFTTLLSSMESPENLPVVFGGNLKAQLAARTVFGLAHRHGDILREGWKNILDCMLQLYRAKLLPKALTEAEDFVDTSGKISIIREENTSSQRSESGVLSSFYSYFTLSEPANTKGPTPEEQEASKQAQSCIKDCLLEHLVTESKFLREESLQELVKALIVASQGPEEHVSMGTVFDEDTAVFFLELLIKVILQNRDRVGPVWQSVRDHIYNLIVNANENTFLVERSVVGLLRLSVRLLRREDIASQVLTSLRILLMMKPTVVHSVTRQIAFALHELIRTNAANIHTGQDWFTLFTLLEVVGAGANPPPILQVCPGIEMSEAICDAGAQSDSELPTGNSNIDNYSDRGYTSDSELYDQTKLHRSSSPVEVRPVPENGSWVLVNKESQVMGRDDGSHNRPPINQYKLDLNEAIYYCDSKSLLKCSETLSFLVRDAAHITPLNFVSCVHAIRSFVEASLHGGRQRTPPPPPPINSNKHHKKTHKLPKSKRDANKMKKSNSSPSHLQNLSNSDDEAEGDETAAGLHSLSIQLLDLMHTLHTRAATIFTSWAAEEQNTAEEEAIDAGHSALWVKCWCPLLQGIAQLCCDARRQVRSQALTYLQRALLVHDLQTLSAGEWEACFNKVLFPLLTKLLEYINPQDPTGVEETRMRASTLLCKVFLQHLYPLLSLSTFTALWLTILDFMDKFMHADRSDLLLEAIPESLKNMLLVMDTAGIFQTGDGVDSQLWKLTWDRIDTFLPNLKNELFKPREQDSKKNTQPNKDTHSPTNQTSELQSCDQSADTSQQDHTPLEGITVVSDKVESNQQAPDTVNSLHEQNVTQPYLLKTPLTSIVSMTTTPLTSSGKINSAVPLLLNPDIMQSTTIQFVSPQRRSRFSKDMGIIEPQKMPKFSHSELGDSHLMGEELVENRTNNQSSDRKPVILPPASSPSILTSPVHTV